jgi:hypothetical protein
MSNGKFTEISISEHNTALEKYKINIFKNFVLDYILHKRKFPKKFPPQKVFF